MAGLDPLAAAALAFDLPGLQQALAHASAERLVARYPGGHTILHALLSTVRFGKAGEISRAVNWRSTNLTLYRYDVVQQVLAVCALLFNCVWQELDFGPCLQVADSACPILDTILMRKPELAQVSNDRGIAPLHIAASEGAECFVDLLLRAGASPTAASQVLHNLSAPNYVSTY